MPTFTLFNITTFACCVFNKQFTLLHPYGCCIKHEDSSHDVCGCFNMNSHSSYGCCNYKPINSYGCCLYDTYHNVGCFNRYQHSSFGCCNVCVCPFEKWEFTCVEQGIESR